MSRLRATAPTVLLSVLALTSCGSAPPPVPEVVLRDRPAIPEELLTCQDAPVIPVAVETDDQVTRLLAALWDAWADCHDKLAGVLARQREDRGQ